MNNAVVTDTFLQLYGSGKNGDIEIEIDNSEMNSSHRDQITLVITLTNGKKIFRDWLHYENEEQGTQYVYFFTEDMNWRLQIPLMDAPYLTHIILEKQPDDFVKSMWKSSKTFEDFCMNDFWKPSELYN